MLHVPSPVVDKDACSGGSGVVAIIEENVEVSEVPTLLEDETTIK